MKLYFGKKKWNSVLNYLPIILKLGTADLNWENNIFIINKWLLCYRETYLSSASWRTGWSAGWCDAGGRGKPSHTPPETQKGWTRQIWLTGFCLNRSSFKGQICSCMSHSVCTVLSALTWEKKKKKHLEILEVGAAFLSRCSHDIQEVWCEHKGNPLLTDSHETLVIPQDVTKVDVEQIPCRNTTDWLNTYTSVCLTVKREQM